MDFKRRKAETLVSLMAPWPDKSPKGSVDAPIAPLLDAINLHSSFFTTSSCSGRISILRQPGESPKPNPDEDEINLRKSKKKAGGGGWIFVSHEPADPEAIVDLLFKSPAAPSAVEMEGAEGATLVFRFEPLIVAVECKDVMAAQELVATAIACGFRESGITSMHKRVMVAIRCSIRLEVPLGHVGLIMVSPEYVRYLIGVANEKMEANRRRTDGFFHVLQDKVFRGSPEKLIHSAKKAQACVAVKKNLLDIEAKQRNIALKESQLKHEEMQSHNQDNISYSVEDKGCNFSQLNGGKLPHQSPVSWSYLEADFFANKCGIQSDAKHLALQIKKKHAKVAKDVLKNFGWLDLTKKVYHNLDGLHICLPISGEFYDFYQIESFNFKDKTTNLCEENVLLEEFSVNEVSIPMALEIFSSFNASVIIDDASYDKKIPSTPQKVMRELVCSLLTEKRLPLGMLKELPVRWERLGDIAVLPVTSFRDPRWNSIAEELWPIVAKSLRALRLARQGRILPTGTRDSTLTILLGDNGWVTHQENGILYSFDATKCMFSSGNLSEKLRMACQDCSDEVIVDLFAGIGYFVLPFLVKAKAKLVYACEWNVHAIKALQHNIHANSVADRCIILEGDNRVTTPEGVADRVCLGLLPSSECSWRTAVRALRSQGGLLYIHGNVKDSEEKSWLEYIIESIGCIAQSEGLLWDVSVQNVERVKSYGPHICHIVADIRCKNSVI